MKNDNIALLFRRVLTCLLMLAIISGSLGGCGVIIIGGNEETTARPDETTAQTESEETTEIPPADTDRDPSITDIPDEETAVTPIVFPSRTEEAEKRLEQLTDSIDIADFEIIIATSSDVVDVLFSDEESPLYAARSKRNSMLYDKYEVDILTIYDTNVDTDTIYKDLLAATQAGDGAAYYLDLFMVPASRAGAFLAKGLIADMRSMPFYDTRSGSMSGNVGYERYFDLGDGTDTPECIYALYFNRDMLGAELSDMLYRASLTSSLTLETILTAASAAEGRRADIAYSCGDGGSLGSIAAELLGISYIDKDRSGVPSLSLDKEELLALDGFIGQVSALSAYAPGEGAASPLEAFIAGDVPFCMGTLSDITALYDKELEWGILTLPSEKGIGVISDARPVVCLPVLNTRVEPTSLWLSGFNAASGDWIRDQFLAVSIENHLRDNASCLTLYKLLMQETELGFERVFSDYYDGLADVTFLAAADAVKGDTSFSEIYARKSASVNKILARLP